MSWPIPLFPEIEYPKRISLRLWLPALIVIAVGAAGAVLLLWPRGKPTNTLQFWATLIGAPLVACAWAFGSKLDQWEDERTDAEESEKEQQRLKGLWRDWTRRQLCVADAVAFLAATNKVAVFAESKVDLAPQMDRTIGFQRAKGRSVMFRCTRLTHLVAMQFADALRSPREVVVTLMLDEASLDQVDVWIRCTNRVFGRMVPGVTFHVEAQRATGGVQWITDLVDRIDSTTRIVIAAQFWADNEEAHEFSEGAAAFLISQDAPEAGLIFRPMTSARDTLEADLTQIKEIQASAERLTFAWITRCAEDESTVIRSALTSDPKDSTVERLLDKSLGQPGPASGWIALAIAMEAMRGAGPQLVAWREPESEPLHLCMISPLPQKETTV